MATYNIKFPINDDVTTNTFLELSQITKEALSSDLLLLILTQKGERYYEPDYGTNLLKYIFEQNDDLTSSDIEKEIKEIVSRYIPTLTVDKITFNWNEDDNTILETQLNVNIRFTYSEDVFSESGELDLNF